MQQEKDTIIYTIYLAINLGYTQDIKFPFSERKTLLGIKDPWSSSGYPILSKEEARFKKEA